MLPGHSRYGFWFEAVFKRHRSKAIPNSIVSRSYSSGFFVFFLLEIFHEPLQICKNSNHARKSQTDHAIKSVFL